MEHAYKPHTILITTWASLDRNGYTPDVGISKKASKVFQTVKLNDAFPVKEEAEKFAFDAAKKWIDEPSGDHSGASAKRILAKPETPLR